MELASNYGNNYCEVETKFIIDCIKHYYPASFIAEELGRTKDAIISYVLNKIGNIQDITETALTEDIASAVGVTKYTVITWVRSKGLKGVKYNFTGDKESYKGYYYIKFKDFLKFCRDEKEGLMGKHFKNFDLVQLKLLNNCKPLPKWLIKEVEDARNIHNSRRINNFK